MLDEKKRITQRRKARGRKDSSKTNHEGHEENRMMKSEHIYLDVCALCRPFDDQQYVRIRLESEAVHLILETVRFKRMKLAVSPVHYEEIKDITDPVERHHLLSLLDNYGERVDVDMEKTRLRAETLFAAGFGVADAAHVAFSEAVGANFISCDDRLMKNAGKTVWVSGAAIPSNTA